MLGKDLLVTPKTIKITVRRITANKDTRTNSIQKLVSSIDSLTYNAKAVVKLRRQLEQEVYKYNNPPCTGIKNAEGRLANFQACLTGTAVDKFSNIVTKLQ